MPGNFLESGRERNRGKGGKEMKRNESNGDERMEGEGRKERAMPPRGDSLVSFSGSG